MSFERNSKLNAHSRALTKRTIEHKKEPIAISRPEIMGQRIRYSHISSIAGVMTT